MTVKSCAGVSGGVVTVVGLVISVVLAVGTPTSKVPPPAPTAVPAAVPVQRNSIVIGTVPDAHRGQQLDVSSAGYAPLTNIDVTLDGSAWHETVRADSLGRVIFTFLVPLEIIIGHYILAITGCSSTTAPPTRTSPAGSMLISVTIPKVTLFQFTVR